MQEVQLHKQPLCEECLKSLSDQLAVGVIIPFRFKFNLRFYVTKLKMLWSVLREKIQITI